MGDSGSSLTARAAQSFLRVAGVPLLIAAASLLLWIGGETVRSALALDRAAVFRGELWRLWSGHLVHLGGVHLLLNGLGLGLVVALCPEPVPVREWGRRLLVLCAVTSTLLLLWLPHLQWYVGLSGVLHGLFLLALWPSARAGDRLARLCLAILACKLAWEAWNGAPPAEEALIGGRVVTQAHLFGTLAGLGYAILFGLKRTGEPDA